MNKISFRPGCMLLDTKDRAKLRDKIMTACYWWRKDQSFLGRNIYYRKMRGETKITELEAQKIDEIFNEINIDPWAGRFKNKPEIN